MYISRGFDRLNGEGAAAEPELPQTLEYLLMHDRLTSLERLARLRESGTLSDEEFAAEKDHILRLPSEELILRPARAAPGPSLFGRLFSWKILALGVLLGLGLAAFTQPEVTLQALQRIGLVRL